MAAVGQTLRRWSAALLLLVAAGAQAGGKAPPAPAPEAGEIARQVVRLLPLAHLSQAPVDAEMSARAWTNYVNMLDFDHSYLLQSDVDRFAAARTTIGSGLAAGDVRLGYELFALFQQRIQERYAFVTNLLTRPFDFTVNEDYAWKRKDAPWPKDSAEQNELWRKRIKNEYLSYVVAREVEASRSSSNRTSAVATNLPALPPPPSNSTSRGVSGAATNAPPPPTPQEFVAKRYEQFLTVVNDADAEFVLTRYLSAVAGAYDPHSEYMSPEKAEDFNIDMSLTLCGIGAQLRAEDGAAKIEEIIPGSPAARDTRSGRLRPGDKIIGVAQGDGAIENVLHMPLTQIVRKIRGKKGTRVVLNVANGVSTRLVDLVRDEIKLEEQAATGRVERVTSPGGVVHTFGVVRLPAFYGTMQQRPDAPGYRSAALDVMRILGMLNASNVEGVVLDLRNDGGGSLREAIELTGAFIRSGPVVQVREARQIHVLPVPDTNPAVAFRRPMVVLVNRLSASASEIVAGALQDYGRAVLVGDPQTHGKGTVQTIIPLEAEKLGQLKVTTASFYRINGLSTQLKGVRPDIVIPSLFDTFDMSEDKLPFAMPWSCVPATTYAPVWELGKWLPTLRAQSAERLAKNARYVSYCRLVQHVRDMNNRLTVPLEKKARLQLATAEDELQKLQNEETKLDDAAGRRDDIIMDESLHILADLVEVSGGAEMAWEPKSDVRQQMLRMFGIGP